MTYHKPMIALMTMYLAGLFVVGHAQETDLLLTDATLSAQYNDNAAGGEGFTKVFDKNSATKYLTFHASTWVQVQVPSAYKLSTYALTSANDAPQRDPLSWTVKGSLDGSTWTTIETQLTQDFPNRLQRKGYMVNSNTAYTYFRFEMKNNSDTLFQLADLEVYGIPPSGIPDPMNIALLGNGGASFSDQWNTASGSESIASLFDNNTTTKYLTTHPATWVQYKCEKTNLYIVTQYNIISGNDASARDPKNWTLKGSVDGTQWSTLDTRINQVFSARNQEQRYSFANANQYRYFRLDISANNGGGECQMAELKFFGTQGPGAGTTIPIADFASGISFVKPGQSVAFTDNSLNATSYLWTFTGGTPAASTLQNPVVAYNTTGSYPVSLSVSNGTMTDVVTQQSWVYVEQAGSWTGFVPPTVTFTDNATTLTGSTIFHNAIPDVAQMMKDQCKEICKKIYFGASSPTNTFTKLNLILENNPTGVAWKAGNPPEITIGISAQYIENFYNSNGKNPDLVAKEVKGMLTHEGTHGYQYSPKNCGGYQSGTDFFGFVEGMADYDRTVVTQFTPERKASVGGNWNDGYNTTGFFLAWIANVKDPEFVIKMNQSGRLFDTWSWDKAIQRILGPTNTVTGLWTEYQTFLKNGGKVSVVKPFVNMSGTSHILRNYPNPFVKTTSIQFHIANRSTIQLAIFNMQGKMVTTLASGWHLPGEYSLLWDGKNNAMQKVAAGTYCCKLVVNGQVQTRNIVMVP